MVYHAPRPWESSERSHKMFSGMVEPLPTLAEGQVWRELDPRQKPLRRVEIIDVSDSEAVMIATIKDGKTSTRVTRSAAKRFNGMKSGFGYWHEDQVPQETSK